MGRKSPTKEKPKKPVGLSFAGEDGYNAYDVLERNKSSISKSQLVIELLNIFDDVQKIYGEDALLELKMIVHNLKNK